MDTIIIILFLLTFYIIYNYTLNKINNKKDAIIFTGMFMFGLYAYKDNFEILLKEKTNLVMLFIIFYYFLKITNNENFETVMSNTSNLSDNLIKFFNESYTKYLAINPDNHDIINLRVNTYDDTSRVLANPDHLLPKNYSDINNMYFNRLYFVISTSF